jgi:hypothetical protein
VTFTPAHREGTGRGARGPSRGDKRPVSPDAEGVAHGSGCRDRTLWTRRTGCRRDGTPSSCGFRGSPPCGDPRWWLRDGLPRGRVAGTLGRQTPRADAPRPLRRRYVRVTGPRARMASVLVTRTVQVTSRCCRRAGAGVPCYASRHARDIRGLLCLRALLSLTLKPLRGLGLGEFPWSSGRRSVAMGPINPSLATEGQ